MSLMSLIKRLVPKPKAEPDLPSIEYKGFTITVLKKEAEGQYHTSAMISRTIDEHTEQATFIRADKHPSFEQAQEHSLQKGQQIIDEQGDSLFTRGHI